MSSRKSKSRLELRAQVVLLHEEGYSYREIAKKLNIPCSTGYYIVKKYNETGSNYDRTKSGRPTKTTRKEDDYIIMLSKRNRKLTAPQIAAEFNSNRATSISVSTVKSRLRSAGMNGRIAAKKPLLREINRRKRLQWAREHKNWSVNDWRRVLWTDESKFELFGSKRRVFVRRRVGEKFNMECITPTVKHGGGSVMVWGCFADGKVGDLKKIEGIMDKKIYHGILQRNAIPSGMRLIGKGFVFQEDNDPKHSSKYCRNYLNKKEKDGILRRMIWPPQSPDLNPIELLWDALDRSVRSSKRGIRNIAELWNCLEINWKSLSGSLMDKLINRMPRICVAVLKAKGRFFNESKV